MNYPPSYLESIEYVSSTCNIKKIMCLTHSYTIIIHGRAIYILVNIALQNILQRGNQWCLLQDNIVTNWNGKSWYNKVLRMKPSNWDVYFYGVVCSAGKGWPNVCLKRTISVNLLQFRQIHKWLDSSDTLKQSTSYKAQNQAFVGY